MSYPGSQKRLALVTGAASGIGRATNPEEIAAGITFLSSSDASFVTGSPFLIDGGLLADL